MSFWDEVLDIGKDKLGIGTPKDTVETISKLVKSVKNSDSSSPAAPPSQIAATAAQAAPVEMSDLVFGMPKQTAMILGGVVALGLIVWAVKS